MVLKPARYELDHELCGRTGCDGRPEYIADELRIRIDDSTTLVRLCEKCRKALATGKWTPTQQALRDTWRPNEKQLHPVVQGALNRDMFQLPPMNWIKEVGMGDRHNGRRRLDLTCFVHKGTMGRERPGIHSFEVKLADDKDDKRKNDQLVQAMKTSDFVWLVVVDGEPDIRFDKRVGLLRYDLRGDRLTTVRRAERIGEARASVVYSAFEAYMRELLHRMVQERPEPAADQQLPLEAAPVEEVSP